MRREYTAAGSAQRRSAGGCRRRANCSPIPPEVGRVIDTWRAMYRCGLIQFHDVRGVGERHAVVPAVLYCELATAVLALESAIGAALEDDTEGEA